MIFLKLRKIKFDAVILANPVPCKYSLRLAKMAGATHIIGADLGTKDIHRPFRKDDFRGLHQVEHTYSYLSAITDQSIPIPPVRVFLTPEERQLAAQRLQERLPPVERVCAVHISSRSPKRRWPVERYAEIINRLVADPHTGVLIFWSPQARWRRTTSVTSSAPNSCWRCAKTNASRFIRRPRCASCWAGSIYATGCCAATVGRCILPPR